MKLSIKPILMCMLLLMVPLFAITGVGADAAKKYAEPSDKLLTSTIAVDSGNFVLVNLNGADTILLKYEDGTPTTDAATIQTIMSQNVYAQANAAPTLAKIASDFAAFNATREPGVSKCKQFTGTNMHPCTDFETCHRACLANPNCALYQDPRFINSIQGWAVQLTKLDAAVADFSSNIASLKTGTVADVDAQVKRLDAVKAAAQEYDNLGITTPQRKNCDTCYEVCAPVNLTAHPLDSMYADLASLRRGLAPLDLVSSKASALKAASDKELAYFANKKTTFATLNDKVASKKGELAAKANGISEKVESSGVQASVDELTSLATAISSDGNKGEYRIALSKEADFDKKAADLSDTLGTLERKYAALTKASKDLDSKIAAGYTVVGNGTAAAPLNDVKAKHEAIKAKLKWAIKESDISAYSDQIKELDSQVKDIVANAALSGAAAGGSASPVGLPPQVKSTCGVGAILALLLGASFAVRKRD